MGAGHGEERTKNIHCMSVTLEVSKLSGWLNADAPCQEYRKKGMRCGQRWCMHVQAKARLQIQARGAGQGEVHAGSALL